MPKRYTKVVLPKEVYGSAAIYEPHPFRSCVISEAVGVNVDTGVKDDSWCWVFYDWCGNAVGVSDEQPDGKVVDRFSAEDIGKELADYLNDKITTTTYR